MRETITLRPQPGPQEMFLSTSADIALYGGAAGGGKSFALLLEPIRHISNKEFGAVIFRRTTKQVRSEGGLFDESAKIYPFLGATPSDLTWKFPSGAALSFAHLEHEKNVYDWQGSQITFIGFDELTHFTKKQFFYMLSRNRSTSGVKPYVRATTNPDKKSWVRNFIDWWIFPKGHPQAGLADPSRSGIVRWFIVKDDTVIWKDHKEDFEEGEFPKSFTFISAKITDNKIMMAKDPSYLANLQAQSRVERAKLLDGNWDAEESPGELFKKSSFPIVKVAPAGILKTIRYWDRAASESDTADWTAGVKLGKYADGKYIVLHVERFRGTPGKVLARIKNVASQDGKSTIVGIEEDPGQAGKADADYIISQLSGFTAQRQRATEDKVTRAGPVSSQVEVGNILVLEGKWNDDFFTELEAFPTPGAKDDQVDGLSGAFNLFQSAKVGVFTSEMADANETKSGMEW